MKIKESLNVTFDEIPLPSKTSPLVDDNLDKEEAIKATEKKNLENDIEEEALEFDEVVNVKESRNCDNPSISEILKKFGLEDSKPMKNPMSSDTKLTKDEECELVDSTKYRGMIASPTSGPYQTNPPSPDDIKLYVEEEREGRVTRIRHDKVINVEDNQILTREIVTVMKTWVEIIRENVFCLGGNRDHVSACLCHILYYIASSIAPFFMSILSENGPYHLDFSLKRELKRSTLSPFSCGMLLTRLVKYVMSESSELSNDRYVLYDHVMYPLTAQQERKTRKDYGTRRVRSSTSSSSAFGQPSSSHPNDDDNDRNDEGTSRASTPSSTHFVNSLSNDIPQIFSNPPNVTQHGRLLYLPNQNHKPSSSIAR
ncbi:hypothetical protein Tco_1192949 [Tanacetum coccineum]